MLLFELERDFCATFRLVNLFNRVGTLTTRTPAVALRVRPGTSGLNRDLFGNHKD